MLSLLYQIKDCPTTYPPDPLHLKGEILKERGIKGVRLINNLNRYYIRLSSP